MDQIETSRLILRNYREGDYDDLYEYLTDAEVIVYEPYKVMTEDEVRDNLQWRIGTDEMVAVELKSNHKMIGNVYLENRDFDAIEMGYVFNQDYWGYGYAKEACTALINDRFAKGTHRFYAECDPDNINSWKLLESICFSKEAHFRKNVYFWKDELGNPIWKDTYVYSLLNRHES